MPQIGVARAQFFPSLSISASGGVGGDSLSSIFDPAARPSTASVRWLSPSSKVGSCAASFSSRKRLKRNGAELSETIAGAFRDVSNALIALNKQRAYREQQEKLVEAAKDATRLARIRYQGGSTDISKCSPPIQICSRLN